MSLKQKSWHSFKIEKVLKELKTSKTGLSFKEARKRLSQYGLNKLPAEKPLAKTIILLNQFKSPLVYILLIASGLTLFLKEYTDMLVILAVVVLNTIIGFFQENKASQAIAKLKNLVEYKTTVIREGNSLEINVNQLVPGDIIVIESGDKIPADARLIEVNNLEVVEAALTGESLPSNKKTGKLGEALTVGDRENMVYLGTVAERGRGLAVVTATGVNTELGKVATLIKETKEDKTPLQKRLSRFSRFLGFLVVFISLIIFLEGLWRQKPFYEMLVTTIAIAVAAIPEGLLVAVTVILALGMQTILKQKALVRKLVAAETLGSTTVICTDKTGTLTVGHMQVAHILSGFDKLTRKKSQAETFKKQLAEHKYHLRTLEIGLLCNDASIENPNEELEKWKIIGDATERALLLAAVEAGLDKKELEQKNSRLAEIPFESDIKFMATLNHYDDQHNVIFIKGAPEKIMAMSDKIQDKGEELNLTDDRQKRLEKEYESLTASGLRVLAVGYKLVNKKTTELNRADFLNKKGEIIFNGLTFVGVFGLKDPLRPEAKETIILCRQAGIKPIIITGDHKLTAKAIAKEIGIKVDDGLIMEGDQIDKLDQKEFKKIVMKVNVYTRVEPRHKLRIIDALQARGEIVAMTGDGINDAPAIKAADIGIALGSGTDVAKETSDIILLDNNFRTIIMAIRQGRAIFDNIRKVIVYLMSDSFTEIILIGGALFFGLPLPLLAVQILWVNLIADGLPNFALAFEKAEKGIMHEPPRRPEEPIMNTEMKALIFIIGIITDLALFAIFFYLWQTFDDMNYIRTFIFMALGIDSLFYIFSCRSLKHSIWQSNPFANKFLNISVLLGFAMLAATIYLPFLQNFLKTVPLGVTEWLWLIILGLFNIIMIEITKYFFIIRVKRKKLKII